MLDRWFVVFAAFYAWSLDEEAPMGKETDPDSTGFRSWLGSHGYPGSYAQSRQLLLAARRHLSAARPDDADMGVVLPAAAGAMAKEASGALADLLSRDEDEKSEMLKEILRASMANWHLRSKVATALRRRQTWKLVHSAWMDSLELDPPAPEVSQEAADDMTFGDLDDEEPPRKKSRVEPSAPSGSESRKRARPPDDEEPPAKRRRSFGNWLGAFSSDWRLALWLGFQGTFLGALGMYGPMLVSLIGCVITLALWMRSLATDVVLKMASSLAGVTSIAGALSSEVDDFMGWMFTLMGCIGLVLVFCYLFEDQARVAVQRFFHGLRNAQGDGGGGAGGAPPGGAAPAAAAAAEPTAAPHADAGGGGGSDASGGLGMGLPTPQLPPPDRLPAGVGDFADRLGLGGPLAAAVPPPGLPAFQPAFAPSRLAAADPHDPRVLPVIFHGHERWRSWERFLSDASSPGDEERAGWALHLRGSPSALEAFKGYRHTGGPLGHHREWVKCSSSVANRPHAHEHYTLCAAVELLCCYDQLHGPHLLGIELLMRRIMLIESAYEYSKDGKAPDFWHASDMMGDLRRASGAVISGSLEDETAARLKARSDVQKQLMKAKEANKPPKKTGLAGQEGK